MVRAEPGGQSAGLFDSWGLSAAALMRRYLPRPLCFIRPRAAAADARPSIFLAFRYGPRGRADGGELGRIHAERLIDVRDDLDDLAHQIALAVVDHLADVHGRDRLTILVELDLADRRVELEGREAGA